MDVIPTMNPETGEVSMRQGPQLIRAVCDEELRSVRGGSFLNRLKKAAKWVKDHVVVGLKYIGYKRTF